MARIKAVQHGFEIIPGRETASSDVSDCGSGRVVGRPERMYCHRTDSLRIVAESFTYPAAPGLINALPLGSLSLKSWTIFLK